MLNRTVLRAWARATLAIVLPVTALTVAAEVAVAPTVASADTTFTFAGGGFGHGVGMSQYGARGAARAGLSVEQILGLYYTGTSVGVGAEPNDLRVRIGVPATATVGSTTELGNGDITLLMDGAFAAVARRGELITLSSSGGRVQARVGNGPTFSGGYAAVEYTGTGSVIQVGPSGTRFDRGVLVVTPNGNNVQVMVHRLRMTEYLYGLAEMPSSWETAALQAQAIAGRSYAINRRRGPSSSFDLEATTVDQVYAGYDKAAGGSFDRWKSAVDSTAGRVVKTPEGGTANALYSSGHGGVSEDNDYVFGGASAPGTPVSYLRSVTEPYEANSGNPLYRWSRQFTGAELGAWFGVGTVTDVRFNGPFGRSGRIDRAQVAITGTGGSKTVRGDAFRRTINSHVGFDRELPSTLILFTPTGRLDSVKASPGGITADGWAWDPSRTGATPVDIYVDGVLKLRGAADRPRPDVGAAVAGAGDNRGFSLFVPVGEGTHRVCANAIDDANQLNPELGCHSVNVPSGATIGNLENAGAATGAISVSGWALDRSRTGPIDVHAYVDGAFGAIAKADVARPDVGGAFPGYGNNHGFSFNVPATPGSHEVCVFGIDDGGPNPRLGCKRVTVAGGSQGTKGNLEGVRRPNPSDPSTVEVRGWALDPDTSASVQVHVYRGNPYPQGAFGGSGMADRVRPDVAAAVPGVGDKHGFTFNVPYAPGRPQVCAHAIDTNGGGNTMIGCATPANVAPFGNFESASRSGPTELRLGGWLLDPDTAGPVTLHVYVGAPYGQGGTFGGAFTANAARADVGQAFPGFGDAHGFDVRVTVPSGATPVYVYAIDDAGVLNALIASKSA